MTEFSQLVSVNFQGIVVVFGRPVGGQSTDIYFNVLAPDVQSDDDSLDWSGFSKLEFPKVVRQVGMGIITFKLDVATMEPSSDPFRVVTDQRYISVVQQSKTGTLYVNRFLLLKTKSGTDQKITTYGLSPAWEVRYSRSHKEDVPADKSDTQDYLDPDGAPFLEPSLELSMIDAVKDGEFDVLLLPISGRASFTWQFLLANRTTSELSFFNFPASENGLFDVTGKKVSADYEIAPDFVCSITTAKSADPLPLKGPPRAIVYAKHERVVQPDGTSIGVKRASRVMIALPVMNGQTLATATIDSAVGNQGTIAKISGPTAASDVQPAVLDLAFDGVSYIKLNGPAGQNPLAIQGASFLISSSAKGDGLSIIGGDQTGDPNNAAPYVRIIDGDKIEVGFGNGSAAVHCRSLHQVLIPGVWASIKIDYAGKGDNPFTLTVNGSVVPLTSCTTGAEPSGTPVALIGATTNGFAGALNSLTIAVAGTEVVVLPCNSVDYTVSPPTTPNTASSGVTVTVFGPRNEPSTSPVNVDMSGTFYIDEMGLTYYAGITNFIMPNGPACLIAGSEALLHLYYQGSAELLSVAQLSTVAARATFYCDWTTNWGTGSVAERHAPNEFKNGLYLGLPTGQWTRVSASVLVAENNTQAGFLNFVAHRERHAGAVAYRDWRCGGACSGRGRPSLAVRCAAGREGDHMISASAGVKIMVATRLVDFRRGADGLAALVREQLHHDPFAGTIFVFRSKRADRLKILAWDGSGLVLLWKRLEHSAFHSLAADQRRRDAFVRITARRADGRPGLVAPACPRQCSADCNVVNPVTN